MPDDHRYLSKLACELLLGAALAGWPLAALAAGAIDTQDFDQVQRGHYLTVAGDCAACHTLPGSGRDFAGGRIVETPFGHLVAPNITPDPRTGIGAWTDDEFVNALTKGTGRHGERLYPAMPFTYYTKLSRQDALAIRAYLNTVPAVDNPIKSDQLPFPFNIRLSMAGWDELFFKPGEFKPDPHKSAQWNRGAYLTEGLGHCGMCHTPKNVAGADETGDALQGYALQGWFAPNITNEARRGLGSWSVDQIAAYLQNGENGIAVGNGLMAETIHLSTSHLTDADAEAIAVYLKDRPEDQGKQQAEAAPASSPPDQTTMKAGEQIYADECSGCHTPDGKGVTGLFPSLHGTPFVQQTDPTNLIHVVLRGALGVATKAAPTAPEMPAFAWVLSDDHIAALLTYVRNSWGNAAPAVGAGDVSKERAKLDERND
ncbi:MAG TPA: c-type cytochrome [Xanthobacteraceae bacterium]|jgi:mono/diheme cytochrome c family protein|nr:c-type cytochrome [Xanthobacteraceae bacterium]